MMQVWPVAAAAGWVSQLLQLVPLMQLPAALQVGLLAQPVLAVPPLGCCGCTALLQFQLPLHG